jgi:MarR family transcriptional regulator, transcriptional regulator for hemolysin
MRARKRLQRPGAAGGQRRVAKSPQSGAGNGARKTGAGPSRPARPERVRSGQVQAPARQMRSVGETDIKVPEVQRTYFEVVPTGELEGSLEDKKLRLTRRILFLSRRWRNDMDEALRATGASHARWITLLWVDMMDGRANIGELAEQVGVELPTLVRLLNRLEVEGLVERRALRGSNRAKTVVLTARGKTELTAMGAVISRARAEFLMDISEDRLTIALEVLDGLLAKYARVVMWPGHFAT